MNNKNFQNTALAISNGYDRLFKWVTFVTVILLVLFTSACAADGTSTLLVPGTGICNLLGSFLRTIQGVGAMLVIGGLLIIGLKRASSGVTEQGGRGIAQAAIPIVIGLFILAFATSVGQSILTSVGLEDSNPFNTCNLTD